MKTEAINLELENETDPDHALELMRGLCAKECVTSLDLLDNKGIAYALTTVVMVNQSGTES